MKVKFANNFAELKPTLDEQTQTAIEKFVFHVETHGLRNLAGRNKPSAIPNPHTKKERANFNHAQKYCLWHYHLGLPDYVGIDGDMTSEVILHYIRQDEFIVLVAIDTHPPFILPNPDDLAY